jgi:uncharacterized membrane protein YgdD (TMEM256/DUF423 family)
MDRIWLAVAGIAGTASIGADTAARHLLGDPYRIDLAATAARYGLVHAAALVALALLLRTVAGGAARIWLIIAGWCLAGGVALFCGGLMVLSANLAPGIVRVVPVGGVLFIAGWAALLIHALSPCRAA